MQHLSQKATRLRNVEIELHMLCFGVLQVHVLGKIHTREPSNGLAVVDNERACERERRTVTTFSMNRMRYVFLPETFPPSMQYVEGRLHLFCCPHCTKLLHA
jgi:hypothetical protein